MSTQIQLRSYQQEAIAAVEAGWQVHHNLLGVAATGAGKTILFLALARNIIQSRPTARVLILAHREELIDQPIERAQALDPDFALRMGIVQAQRDDFAARVIVASVQTVVNPRRLERILSAGLITHVITDEAHHATAASYRSIYDMLRVANPELRHLGVTATPKRSDGDGLVQVYDAVAFKLGIKELIKLGYLVPFKAMAVETGISLKGVRTQAGDFAAGDLAKVYELDNCFELVAETHLRYAPDRRGIAFTASVAGAHRLAEKFVDAGIAAAAADGTTPRDERRELLRRFRCGELQVLCNCALFTEGLDVPEISVIHQVRPTKSDLTYSQMAGRGLRPVPDKNELLILDYVPLESRDIVLAGDLLGKPRSQKKAEKAAEQAGVILESFSFTGEGTGIDGDPDELVMRELNYLSLSPFAWFHDAGLSTLGCGEVDGIERTLALALNRETGLYGLVCIERTRGSWQSRIFTLGTSEDFGVLSEQGADYAEQHGSAVLAAKEKSWRRQRPSDKQLALLRRLLPDANGRLATLSRGDASKLITHQLARQALTRARTLRGVG